MQRRPALFALLLSLFSATSLTACGEDSPRYGVVDESLALDRVVLYRNGVGYFERRGEVDGDILKIRVRKDQVDDLLKSLTVVDQEGQAVSVSMPLDAESWASPALKVLAPGRGSLAQVLDSMRGTEVTLSTTQGDLRGRVMMVEEIINEPDPSRKAPAVSGEGPSRDHKVTLMQHKEMHTVRLSKVSGVKLHNGDLAVQLNRKLDASAGEGMFAQVDVEIRLNTKHSHELMVSYVAAAPIWKPTYRVVLPEEGKGTGLLQGWAVVDNLSGEDWAKVKLSLTSGAPIAFRYDLHTPRNVFRTDLSEAGTRRRARVAMGETSFVGDMSAAVTEVSPVAQPSEEEMLEDEMDKESLAFKKGAKTKDGYGNREGRLRAAEKAMPAPKPGDAGRDQQNAADGPALDMASLRRSTAVSARTSQVTGLTQTDLEERVTVPDGTSTMVALLNADVEASETFLFRPGGAGTGYESSPYRVVRFKNNSDHVLEPGPISIYAGGSFVGEGISEVVGAGASATIPFAVEPGIAVTQSQQNAGAKLSLVRIVRGVLEAESFQRSKTHYEVRVQPSVKATEVLVRHVRYGANYTLNPRPEGSEDLDGAYLIPVTIPAGKNFAELDVIEETPSTVSLTMWDGRTMGLLDQLMSSNALSPEDRKRLQPIVDKRQAVGRIDTEVAGLRSQQTELDRRANETRRNLEAIKQDPRASTLRGRLSKRLDEFTRQADAMGRKIVDLNSQRLELKISLEDMLVDFDFRAPKVEPAK